jgi:hypothetical protein
MDFQKKLFGALSVGDVRKSTIPSLLPSQNHFLKAHSFDHFPLLPPVQHSGTEMSGGKENNGVLH